MKLGKDEESELTSELINRWPDAEVGDGPIVKVVPELPFIEGTNDLFVPGAGRVRSVLCPPDVCDITGYAGDASDVGPWAEMDGKKLPATWVDSRIRCPFWSA